MVVYSSPTVRLVSYGIIYTAHPFAIWSMDLLVGGTKCQVATHKTSQIPVLHQRPKMAQLKPQNIVIVGAGLAVRHQPKLIELLS